MPDSKESDVEIGVIGVGRLGICFGLLLAEAGYRVRGVDVRRDYIDRLQARDIDTHEPQVRDMLRRAENFSAHHSLAEVVVPSDVIYVMVATPSLADGSYDVSAVWRVVRQIQDLDVHLDNKVLVIGCTVNPGDTGHIQNFLRARGVHVIYNPEFIAQGSIVRDLQQADMVLIGGEHKPSIDRYQEVYHRIQTREPSIHVMSSMAAEVVKIGINCFLTTKISYANMIGEVLARSGQATEIERALCAIGQDSRIGQRYLRYGFGFGGPCLPRDNRALAHYAKKIGLDFPLGTVVDQFNRDHTEFLAQQVIASNPNNLPFYMPSITYKPGTDIVEESQQLALCRCLLARGHRVYVEPDEAIPLVVRKDLEVHWPDLVQFRSRKELAAMLKPVSEILY